MEQAFVETDQMLFEVDEAGNWVNPLSTDWEYSRWFSEVLADKIALNDGQVKTLFGKFSRLDDVFTRLNLQAFWLVNKRVPKPSAPGDEGKLARKVKYNLNKRDGRKMNPEVEGYIYGNMPANLKMPKPSYGPKGRAPSRTPEQVWEEVTQFIREHDRIPRQVEDDYERKLRCAWDYIYSKKKSSNDPYVKRLIKLHDETVKQYAVAKTPQEWLAIIEPWVIEHKRWPLGNVEEEKEMYIGAQNTMRNNPDDPASVRLKELKDISFQPQGKTPQEILEYTTTFMREHNGKLPSQHSQDSTERSYRRALYTFHQKYKDLTDEQVEELPEPDRTLEKLYRQNVRVFNKKSAE